MRAWASKRLNVTIKPYVPVFIGEMGVRRATMQGETGMRKPTMITGALALGATIFGVAQAPTNTVSADTQSAPAAGEKTKANKQLTTEHDAKSEAAKAQSVAAKRVAVSQAQSAVSAATSAAAKTQSTADAANHAVNSAKSELNTRSTAASSAADFVETYPARKSHASSAADSATAIAAADSIAASVAAAKAASAAAYEAAAKQAASRANVALQSAQNTLLYATTQVQSAQKRVDTIAKIPALSAASKQTSAATTKASSAASKAVQKQVTAELKARDTAAAEKAATNLVNASKNAVSDAQKTVNQLTVSQDAQLLADVQKALNDAIAKRESAQAAVNKLAGTVGPYTSEETAAINAQNKRYAQLKAKTASLTNIYEVTPQTDANGRFVAGKLTDEALQNAVDWLNYYRELFGVGTVTANPSLTQRAQITAAVEATARVMTHHLEADAQKPQNVSDEDWQVAKKGAAASSLYSYGGTVEGLQNLFKGWLLDDSNVMGDEATVGHRQTMLGTSATTIGFGTADGVRLNSVKGSSALTMSPDIMGQYNRNATGVVSYPAAKLFPVSLVAEEAVLWSIDLGIASGHTLATRPTVTIKNLATGTTQRVAANALFITTRYSREGTSVAFKVKQDGFRIQAGDRYEVSVTTQQGSYSYQFRLYDDTKQFTSQEAFTKANADLAAAQTAVTTAQNKLTALQAQLGNRPGAIADAIARLNAAQTRLAKDQQTLATAKTTNAVAQAALGDANRAVATTNAALAAARAAQSAAQTLYQDALAVLGGQSIADASKAAQAVLAEAKMVRLGAQREFDVATQTAADANQTLALTQRLAATARDDAAKATVKARASQKVATNAADAYANFPTKEEAKARLAHAKAALARAQTEYDVALAASEAANGMNDDAQATLAAAQAKLIVARGALAEAEAVVEQAGTDAKNRRDAQAQLDAKMALREQFDRQLDRVDHPVGKSDEADNEQSPLPQAGDTHATGLEVVGFLLVLLVMARTYRRQRD